MSGAQRLTRAALRWAQGVEGPTEHERRPPRFIDRVTTAMDGASELMERLFPTEPSRIVASGMVAVGSLALTGVLFHAVLEGDPAPTDGQVGVDLTPLRDALSTVGGLITLLVGSASGYACLHATVRHCVNSSPPGARDNATEAESSESA